MAKKKAAIIQSTGADELTREENELLDAKAAADAQAAPAPQSDFWTRAQQGATMAGYEVNAAHGLQLPTGTTAYNEWKPAEATPVMDAADIPAIAINAARPAWEAEQSENVPGAGDPQNGMLLPATPVGTDPSFQAKPIAWMDTRHDIAQHYPWVEA